MIKIAICDDDKNELNRASTNCFAYAATYPEQDIRISTFDLASDLIKYLEVHDNFDIYILDIYMPNTSGVELAKTIRERDDESEIIFLTSSTVHAIEAFSLHAAHYLVKPYSLEKFDNALAKAFKQLEKTKKAQVTLKSITGVHKVLFSDFLYAETEKHLQHIHLKDGTSLRVRMSSIELFDRLNHEKRFYKCGSTYILNLGKIKEITPKLILFDNQQHIFTQRRHYKHLIDTYTRYSLERGE